MNKTRINETSEKLPDREHKGVDGRWEVRWETVVLVPIHEKGKNDKYKNYRRIDLLGNGYCRRQ